MCLPIQLLFKNITFQIFKENLYLSSSHDVLQRVCHDLMRMFSVTIAVENPFRLKRCIIDLLAFPDLYNSPFMRPLQSHDHTSSSYLHRFDGFDSVRVHLCIAVHDSGLNEWPLLLQRVIMLTT